MDLTAYSTSFRFLLFVLWLITRSRISLGDKLSPGQKAPLFAQGAGGLRLEPPFEGPVKTYAAIIKETNQPNLGNGEYSFSFETEDGVQRQEVGKLKKVGDELVTVVEGRYSYTSPEGLAIDVKYSADENGARSSFTFGTDPGRWKQSLSLPGFPGNKGKLTDYPGGEGYLPPSGPGKKISNDYLPPFPPKKITKDYLPPKRR